MSVPWEQWEGQVVDGCFPLRRRLASTDESAVFLTEYGHPEPRDAAIKLVVAEAQDMELRSQWERASQLEHPHLLRIWRMGHCQVNRLALDYLVTEYAEENLAAVLTERPLTAVEAREMLEPVLEALAYIHGEGLVHGHLKPANIMAAGDQLKLSVAGISRVGDAGTAPSQPEAYDPLEFADRGRSPVGDIWSLGATLVEALTLRLPTPADPRQEPQLPETLPVEFVSIARACLQPDPRRRATPGELAALLRQSGAEPQKQRPPAVPNAARKPRWAVLVAGVGIALAVIFAGPRLLHRPEPAPKPAAPKQETPQAVPPQTIAPQVVAKTRGEKASAVGAVPQVAKERKSSRGDAAPGVAPGDEVRRTGDQSHAAVRQVLPEITAQARATIRGRVTINVRASVDASGHVTSARLESGNSRYFANLTLEAARQWVFEPTASEWLLRFDITSAGTVVQPSRVAP